MQNLNIYTGLIKRHADHANLVSAIDKRGVSDTIMLNPLGLENDQQADKNHHGGVDRALCHYPQEHYLHWKAQFPELADRFDAPAFGENISTLGMTEQNVFIGDIYRWGNALIQVTQPRSPCHKLNTYFGIENMSTLMQDTGLCGWLYRVINVGEVSDQQPITLLSRNSSISVAEAISIAFHSPYDEESYQRLMSAAGLSASWHKTMQMRLLNQHIESFDRRLKK